MLLYKKLLLMTFGTTLVYCTEFEGLSNDYHEVTEENNDKSQRCEFPDR